MLAACVALLRGVLVCIWKKASDIRHDLVVADIGIDGLVLELEQSIIERCARLRYDLNKRSSVDAVIGSIQLLANARHQRYG